MNLETDVEALERKVGREFVGREQELAVLTARLDAAVSGSGGTVLLAGEPGIGKTRTAEELASVAATQNVCTLWGRCTEGEGAPAFWPWVQILRAYFRDEDPELARFAVGLSAPSFARLVPELFEGAGDQQRPLSTDPEQELFLLFDSMTSFLRAASRSRPLLIVLDDLHCADTPSLRLLQFLVHELAASHILIVGTYRDVEVDRGHALTPTLAELARIPGTERISLKGLAEHEVAQYLEAALGVPASPTLVSAVQRQTEGNLFFVTEVVRLLSSEGGFGLWAKHDGAQPQLEIPYNVRDVIGFRLGRLSDPCNRLLEIGAVIGRQFPAAALGRVLGMQGDPPLHGMPVYQNSDRLLATLEDAERARIIMDVPGSPGYFRFAHVLIREMLYNDLLSTRRARLHRLVGEALEAFYAADPTPHLTELAHHFGMGVAAGGAEKAVSYSWQAGDYAVSLYSYSEAEEHYQRALQALELLPGDGSVPVPLVVEGQLRAGSQLESRCDLLLCLGEAQRLAGEMNAARQTLVEAASFARRLDSPDRLARSALGFGLDWYQVGQVDAALVELLEEALTALGGEDSATKAMLQTQLARALHGSESHEQSLVLGRQAVAMAERVGDYRVAWQAVQFQAIVSAPAPVKERLSICDKLEELAQAAASPVLKLRTLTVRLVYLWELGDASGAARVFEAFSSAAEELRQPSYQSMGLLFRAVEATNAGRFADAAELAQQALTLGQKAGRRDAFQAFVGQIFLLRLLQGQLDELISSVRDLSMRNPNTPVWRCVLAYLYAEMGREAEARADLAEVTAQNLNDLPADTLWLFSVAAVAAAAAAVGDEQRSAMLYDRLLPYADQCVVVGGGIGSLGAAAHTLGMLATTLHRWDDARRHFEAALLINARLAARPWLARTQHAYADLLLTNGVAEDRARGVELAQQALDTARELNMARLLDQTQRLLDRPAASMRPVYPDGLTAREVEVLRLIAQGRMTREIADILVVSQATVERHITNLYTKIGARNRADAAAYALRQGLT